MHNLLILKSLRALRSMSATGTEGSAILELSSSFDLKCNNLMCANLESACVCRLEHTLQCTSPAVLSRIEFVDLSCNGLTHLPPSLITLHALKELNLANNAISKLPDDILSMKSLKKIDVRRNPLLDPLTLSSHAIEILL